MYYKYHGINIYYEKYGNSKKTILILPGWGNTRNTFYDIINFFKNYYTLYIVDYPGFGNSPILNKDLTIYDYAKIIYSFINEKNINNISIISHSFGGRIASILIGKHHLNIDKLILIDVAGVVVVSPSNCKSHLLNLLPVGGTYLFVASNRFRPTPYS